MLKPRYWVRLFWAFIARFKGILFVGLVLGLFLFAGAWVLMPLVMQEKPEIIGMTGRYHVEELPEEVLNEISDGLTEIGYDGVVKPGLAERWESDEEGKKWTFWLKDDVVWQDGTKLVAADVNYSFEDVSIEKLDERTLVFSLKSRFAPFPTVVSRPVFKKGLLGTGEWKVNKLTLASGYVEKIAVERGKGEKRVIRFYPNEEQLKTAFKLGEVDKMVDLISAEPFGDWPKVRVEEEMNRGRYVAIFLNNSDELFLNNKSLRQALYYAIDKESFGERALGPISPDSWAFNPQVKTYEYDLEHAKTLLEEMGEAEVTVRLVTTPALLEVAEAVSAAWAEAGVKTSVLVSSVLPSEYQAFLAIYDLPKDPDQYATWHSTQMATNISKYSNPRIDKLLEDGRLELNEEERKKIYWDFQRFLLEDAPAIFLYHPVSYTVTRE